MGDSLKDARDRALLLLGFAGGLRRSELVGLDLADIDRVRQGIVLHLRRSKTDQEGHGQKIGIPHGRTRCCPVAALDAWLAASRITEGAVFRPVDRHGRVQYVKICSLYGAGFYYIPGTDMCLKVGGWVRAEYAYGGGNSMTTGPFAAGYNARTTNNDFVMRTRGYITMDARNQSEYGTIRSYIAVGVNYDSPAGAGFSSNRAFIQFAGFTFGTSQSFYDFYSSPATAYWGGAPSSDSGDPGWKVAAYTAQFGNGLSATIAAEEPRQTGVFNGGSSAPGVVAGSQAIAVLGTLPGATDAAAGANITMPDFVANLRVDQAWGSAQIMGAVHHVNSGYYGATNATSLTWNGHPSDAYGYALGAGIKLNAPMIGQGDYFQSQVNYTQGAMRYASFTENGTASPFSWNGSGTGGSVGYGWVTDGVFAGTTTGQTAVQLTTAWVVDAAYEHFWNKPWRTSLYGGYLGVSYYATANAAICVNGSTLAGGQTSAGGLSGFSGTCNNNWGQWWLGSRPQWNVTPDTYLGLDVLYQDLLSANSGQTATYAAVSQTPQPAGVVNIADQHAWSFRFRVHKDYYP